MQTTLDDNKKFADFIANNYKKKKKRLIIEKMSWN
jgi:hypothetical protein